MKDGQNMTIEEMQTEIEKMIPTPKQMLEAIDTKMFKLKNIIDESIYRDIIPEYRAGYNDAIDDICNHIKDEDLLLDYFNLDDKDKLDKWLFETYEEWLESNDYIDENKFYEYYKYSEIFNDVPSYWFYQKVLYERLGDSIKTTSNIFYKLLNKVKGIEAIDVLSDYIIKIFYNDTFNKNSEEFQSLMNFGNYFIQSEQENNSLCIEARIPKEIKNYDFDFLYHVTFKSNYHKIKKYGLTPKNSSKSINHDYKIYLWSPNANINTIKTFGRLQTRLKNKEDFIILKIDLKKFNNDHSKKIKLFGDPKYTNKNALFTLENIPSKYISEYKE